MAVSGKTLIQAVSLHFGSGPSSCALQKPESFQWTTGNEMIRVYCELHLGMIPLDKTRKKLFVVFRIKRDRCGFVW